MPIINRVLCALLLCLILLITGCSEIEPQTGTRVTFDLPKRNVTGEQIAALSRYLMLRSQGILGVERARVESVENAKLVLLIPGSKVARHDIEKLITGAGIEFYHMANVATKKHPGRTWHLNSPTAQRETYVFTGPGAQRIDSRTDASDLLRLVVGSGEKPVITGNDIEPNSQTVDVKSGWRVLIHLTSDGSAKFYEFTKNNVGEYLAVFYNGQLMSAAVVQGPIKGGVVYLTGFTTVDEARAAVAGLNSGVLPVAVKIGSVVYY